MQKFINVGIDSATDLESGGFSAFETKHVYKPDLFGSPSPRMTTVSSQVHWRNVSNDWTSGVTMSAGNVGQDWIGVPGLCTRVKVTERAKCIFTASFYVFEMGGATEPKASWKYNLKTPGGSSSTKDSADRERTSYGHEYHAAGYAALFIDGDRQSSTVRTIHTSNVLPTNRFGELVNNGHIMFQMISRHQQTISKKFTLGEGVHDIGIMCRPREIDNHKLFGEARDHNSMASCQEHKNIYFLARSMVADVIYDEFE